MKFIEFDVDFEECGEVEEVILHDMYGRHESIVLKRGAEYRKPTILSQLEADNARLRELVRDMYEMAYPEYPSAFAAAFADRMARLGMEVDG